MLWQLALAAHARLEPIRLGQVSHSQDIERHECNLQVHMAACCSKGPSQLLVVADPDALVCLQEPYSAPSALQEHT